MSTSICIYGAGAIGLDLAWHCVKGGFTVTLIARGATFDALKDRGILHLDSSVEAIAPSSFRVVPSSREAGPHDMVFLTTKADDLLKISQDIPSLIAPNTVVVSATNGIPPWYSYGQERTIGRFSFPIEPRTQFLSCVAPFQLVGAIVERSSELYEPGVILRSSGKGFTIGELDHRLSHRCAEISEFFNRIGFTATVSNDIHRDIWLKLIGNVAVNPLSVLTEQTIGEMLGVASIRDRMSTVARETEQVGVRLGVIQSGDFREDDFFSFMRDKLGHHRPSMLQDFVQGKGLEVHRILDVVEMLARAPGPVPPVSVAGIKGLQREIDWKVGRSRSPELSP